MKTKKAEKANKAQVEIAPELLAKSEAMRKEISELHQSRMAKARKNLPKTN